MASLVASVYIALVGVLCSSLAQAATIKADVAVQGGACGFDIFVGLTASSTYFDAKKVFYDACLTGANAHPKELCKSGADELFKNEDLSKHFNVKPDDPFCKMTDDILDAHRRWSQENEAVMFLRAHANGKKSSLDSSVTSK
eukprot:TRINITY_DN17570_c0_g1_i1.p1 TRINITY_DN17570_c0_g1~~TRINITY_DN17570_c0_g1_i1.p1  ORF type:complete len:142 (+),score=36.63 TRINITY_DN17570_c0_g1_i1:76-501(+)